MSKINFISISMYFLLIGCISLNGPSENDQLGFKRIRHSKNYTGKNGFNNQKNQNPILNMKNGQNTFNTKPKPFIRKKTNNNVLPQNFDNIQTKQNPENLKQDSNIQQKQSVNQSEQNKLSEQDKDHKTNQNELSKNEEENAKNLQPIDANNKSTQLENNDPNIQNNINTNKINEQKSDEPKLTIAKKNLNKLLIDFVDKIGGFTLEERDALSKKITDEWEKNTDNKKYLDIFLAAENSDMRFGEILLQLDKEDPLKVLVIKNLSMEPSDEQVKSVDKYKNLNNIFGNNIDNFLKFGSLESRVYAEELMLNGLADACVPIPLMSQSRSGDLLDNIMQFINMRNRDEGNLFIPVAYVPKRYAIRTIKDIIETNYTGKKIKHNHNDYTLTEEELKQLSYYGVSEFVNNTQISQDDMILFPPEIFIALLFLSQLETKAKDLIKSREVIPELKSLTYKEYIEKNPNTDCKSCAICLEDYEDSSEISIDKCKHFFHKECRQQHLSKSTITSCPVCRQ